MSAFDPELGRLGYPGAGLLDAAEVMQQIVLLLGGAGRHRGLLPVLQGFERQGLAHLAASWVGVGRNLPISPAQITQGLGDAVVEQLARAAGVPRAAAIEALCVLLPLAVDGFTPSGVVPLAADHRPARPDTNVTAR